MDSLERRHTILNSIGEFLWGLGGNLAAPLTVLALVITRLGGTKLEVGLLSAIGAAGFLFPQIFSSLYLQHGAGRKWYLINFHFIYLLPPWALMGVCLILFGEKNPLVARIALPILYALYVGTIGFMLPVWMDWIAVIFPQKIRGQAIGWASTSTAAGGIIAAFTAGALTPLIAYPYNYATLFFIGAGLFAMSMVLYMFFQDDSTKEQRPWMTRSEIFSRFWQSLREPNFRKYLISRLLLTAGGGPVAFYAVYYKSAEGGGLEEQTVIALGAALSIAQAVASIVLGRLGDKMGHKIGAAVGAFAQLTGLIVVIFVPGWAGCMIAFVMVGLGFASGWVSHQNLLFETCPHDSRTAHITVTNLVLAPLTTLVPILTGKAVDVFGMQATFGVCIIPVMLGLVWFLAMVKEPRTILVR